MNRAPDYVVELHPAKGDGLIFESIAPNEHLAEDSGSFLNVLNGLVDTSDIQASRKKPIAGDLNALTRQLILRYAQYTTPPQVSDDASPEEMEKDNARRFNALTTRKRFVLRSWPRDPAGKPITPENSCLGKMTSNGVQLWGATMWDFYNVRRLPEVRSYITRSTGSKLAKWMKGQGELEWAKDEIEWAEREEDPKELFPCDIGLLIQDMEKFYRIHHDGEMIKNWREKRQLPPQKSLFEPRVYPPKFLKAPFGDLMPRPTLQQRIPLHLLPKKLIVHDPWYLLAVCSHTEKKWDKAYTWGSKEDVTHVYKLSLSPDGRKRMVEDEEAAKKEHEKPEKNPDGLERHEDLPHGFLLSPAGPIIPDEPIEPLIYVVHDPPPLRLPAAEAHLYISPAYTAGVGNHSAVYHAEWELPRSLFVPEILCQHCVAEDVQRIITEEDGENGKKMAPQWKEKSAKWVQTMHVKGEITTEVVRPNKDGTAPASGSEDADVYVISPRERKLTLVYDGPLRFIRTGVKHQNLERGRYCAHLENEGTDVHPLSSRVRVAAKLSKRHDEHLELEATNYQKFPRHFFEHWNGFNVINPLHEPTPVGALVPQFYGYYVPTKEEWVPEPCEEEEVEGEKDDDKKMGKEGGGQGSPMEVDDKVKPQEKDAEASNLNTIEGKKDEEKKSIKEEDEVEKDDDVKIEVDKMEGENDKAESDGDKVGGEDDEVKVGNSKVGGENDSQVEDKNDSKGDGEKSKMEVESDKFNGENDKVEGDSAKDENNESKSNKSEPERTPSPPPRRPTYLSPILLLEECGKQINPTELSIDDRNECASLIYRFHDAGWYHGSIYARNILWQPGPITDWPINRMANALNNDDLLGHQWNFRLIDFGRTDGPSLKGSWDRVHEKTTVARLMDILGLGDSGQ